MPKYFMTQDGELIVRNVSKSDVGQYKCRARHRLTGRTLTSSIGGLLILNDSLSKSSGEASAGRALDPIDGQTKLLFAREHGDLLFCAKFQLPSSSTLQWYKLVQQAPASGLTHRLPIGAVQNRADYSLGGVGSPPLLTAVPLDSCLLLNRVQDKHAGDYICELSDSSGVQARASFRLIVGLRPSAPRISVQTSVNKQAQLKAAQDTTTLQLQQPLQQQQQQQQQQQVAVVQAGSQVQLQCSIESNGLIATGLHMAGEGGPTRSEQSSHNAIDWLKDGRLVASWRRSDDQTSRSQTSIDQGAQDGETFTAGSADKTASMYRLLRNNQLQIDHFELGHRGVYQCQTYFVDEPSETSNQPPRISISTELARENDRQLQNQQQSMTAGQIETKLERLRRSSSSSAMIQLDVALSRPQLLEKFPATQTLDEDAPLSLECSASGVPLPRITWYLDNFRLFENGETTAINYAQPSDLDDEIEILEDSPHRPTFLTNEDRFRSAAFSSNIWTDGIGEQTIRDEEKFQIKTWRLRQSSVLVSQLNVSSVRGSESGTYKCVASNALGESVHFGRLQVVQHNLAAAQLRSYQPTNVTLIAGQTSALLQCPLSGYPLRQVSWFLNGRQLPLNHRQRIEPIRSGWGGQLELLNVDVGKSDEGVYTCSVHLGNDAAPMLDTSSQQQSNSSQQARRHQYETSSEQQLGQIQVSVRVAPLIDAQLLPAVVEANEGLRTKLVCSVAQGEHPIELRWLKRVSDRNKVVKLFTANPQNTGAVLHGFEPILARRADNSDNANAQVTIHDFDDSSLLTFRQISHNDDGEYLCLAQNSFSATQRQVRVIVHRAPSWSIEPPGELQSQLGQRLQIDCLAHGNPNPIGSWSRAVANGADAKLGLKASNMGHREPITGHSSNQFVDLTVSNLQTRVRVHPNGTLIIEQVEPSDSGVYMCEQANSIGSGLSKLSRLLVRIPPHFKVQQQHQQFGKLGGQAELKCVAHGDQPMLIGWRKQEHVIDLINDQLQRRINEFKLDEQTFESTLSISNLTRADSGAYTCIASNELGTEEQQIVLVVQEPPEAPGQLVRPMKAEARRATLAFVRPFSGNSAIRKYAIYLRALQSDELPMMLDAGSIVIELEQYINSSSLIMMSSTINNNNDKNWQQVLIDAPLDISKQDNVQRRVTAHNLSNLVELNLCCLKPFTRYLVRMRAINDIGQSEASKAFVIVTDEETIGGPPLDVGVEPTGAHSLKVRWRPPAKHFQNGIIRGYYIGYRAMSSSTPIGLQMTRPNEMETENVAPNLEQQQQFQYKNIQLNLDPIQWRQLLGAQSPESNSLAANTSSTSIQLSNQQSAHQVYTSYLTNLRRKTNYAVIVQAYNKVGAGPRSDQIVVSTLEAAPPMSPVLKLVSVTYDSAQLSWTSRKFAAMHQHQSPSSHSGEAAGQNSRDNGEVYASSNEIELDGDDDPQSYYTLSYRLDEHNRVNVDQTQSKQTTSGELWQQKRISRPKGRQAPILLLQQLRCGSPYLAFMTATNSLGQSEPGETIRFNTMGGAPVAPANSRDFLQVNSSYVVLRLNEWHNAGCLIVSFSIRYRQQDSSNIGSNSGAPNKWVKIEHQVHPTIQTVTSSGNAVYSSSSSSRSIGGTTSGEMILHTSSISHQRQLFNDLIVRNLQASSGYHLVVEAISEAGSSVAEYEFETGNFSSSTIGVTVNGLVATDPPLSGANQQLDEDALARYRSGGELLPHSGSQDFNLLSSGAGAGSHRASSIFNLQMQGQKYSLGVWSLTLVFVAASILMAIITLVLSFKSVLRMKHRTAARQRRASLDTGSNNGGGRGGGNGGGGVPDVGSSLFSSLFPCRNAGSSSASSSSMGGCSNSSTTGPNSLHCGASNGGVGGGSSELGGPNTFGSCYQVPSGAHLSSIEATYCSLPVTNQHMMLAESPAEQSPSMAHNRQQASMCNRRYLDVRADHSQCSALRHQLVPSTSMSTLAARQRSHTLARHASSLGASTQQQQNFAATLGRSQFNQRQGDERDNLNVHNLHATEEHIQQQQQQSSSSSAAATAAVAAANNLIRAHYAATLGRQRLQSTTFSSAQPIKFNSSNADSPLYGRLDKQQNQNLISPTATNEQHSLLNGIDQATTSSGYETGTSLNGHQQYLATSKHVSTNNNDTNSGQQVYLSRQLPTQMDMCPQQSTRTNGQYFMDQPATCMNNYNHTQLALNAAGALESQQQMSSFLDPTANQQQIVKDPYGLLFAHPETLEHQQQPQQEQQMHLSMNDYVPQL